MTDLPTPITHPLLDIPGIRHGFFTREGGVSTGIYKGLNTGVGSSDDPEAVRENRALVAAAMGATPDDFAACYQIHSDIVHMTDQPFGDERPEGDAVIAVEEPGILCAVLTADCAPILIANPRAGMVAAVHAGWKGAVGGVIEATLRRMKESGAEHDQTIAVVGPTIAQASYEVDEAFEERFLRQSSGSGQFFVMGKQADRRQFDLPGYVMWKLQRAGVGQIAWTGHDTEVDPDRFYSNRRAHLSGEPDFGRMMSVITLD
ncbi:MAG: peptidoglycan editing factor PgeF [Alphaproteobacteria bacterium]|nr:peptidoglycan editing factor PgeF [Alphaproteobacteria bacterium]